MSDNRKYYYLKLKENFFETDSMILLESMNDGYLYSNILMKLYLRSLKDDGRLMLNGRIPYNSQMIANITRHQVGTVEKALDIFKELDLIDILDNGAIYMLDIQNFIGESSSEADRKRSYRSRIEKEKITRQMSEQMSGQISDKNPPEIELEIEKEIDIELEIENRVNYQQIADMYNNTCVSFPKITKLSEARKKAIKARMKVYSLDDFKKLFEMAESSSFLKGQNNRNWSANFDWLIKDTNMAKVLDGNYEDKEHKRGDCNAHGNTEERGNSASRKPASAIYAQYLPEGHPLKAGLCGEG
jgi:phage_rep_org_N: phage replisome organizer, putative, N-terminal region